MTNTKTAGGIRFMCEGCSEPFGPGETKLYVLTHGGEPPTDANGNPCERESEVRYCADCANCAVGDGNMMGGFASIREAK